MKRLTLLFVGLLVSISASSAFAGEGLPLPWPFPWAKDCPIDWQSLEGRYQLSDSSKEEQLQLSIHVVTHLGFKLVRVSRYSSEGELIAEGFNLITANQRTLWLSMMPLDRNEPTMKAYIKLYYQSSNLTCGEQNLVPILTVEKRGSNTTSPTQYRLVRIEE